MDMTPQAYPLELTTEDGERWLVIGWIPSRVTVEPVAVRIDGPSRFPVRVEGPVEYRRPPST